MKMWIVRNGFVIDKPEFETKAELKSYILNRGYFVRRFEFYEIPVRGNDYHDGVIWVI